MIRIFGFIIMTIMITTQGFPNFSAEIAEFELEIVSRKDWGARKPTLVENMTNPVPFVVIHHSYIPAVCFTKEECIKAMQAMQDYHQLNHTWNDIGYNFAAGGDGRIYMGRGWSAVGAHAPGYNNKSIGICIIGDWRENVPEPIQLRVVNQLIEMGVKQGFIQEEYKLVGHQQVRNNTECPGQTLYKEIQGWAHWTEDPTENHKKKCQQNISKAKEA